VHAAHLTFVQAIVHLCFSAPEPDVSL
jgi:hypothetical protein